MGLIKTTDRLVRIGVVRIGELRGAGGVEASQISAVIDTARPVIRRDHLKVLSKPAADADEQRVIAGPGLRIEVGKGAEAIVQVRIGSYIARSTESEVSAARAVGGAGIGAAGSLREAAHQRRISLLLG